MALGGGNVAGIMILFTRYVLASVLVVTAAVGQPARMGGGGERAFATVPMVGKGTWEDPRRPAFVAEAGIAFRYQVSDDGNTALVELAPGSVRELARLEAQLKAEPGARLFRSNTHKLGEITAEMRKLKRDFDPDSVAKPANAVVTGAN
jgi:hypothetical protein